VRARVLEHEPELTVASGPLLTEERQRQISGPARRQRG
jgi:hypothetical protein